MVDVFFFFLFCPKFSLENNSLLFWTCRAPEPEPRHGCVSAPAGWGEPGHSAGVDRGGTLEGPDCGFRHSAGVCGGLMEDELPEENESKLEESLLMVKMASVKGQWGHVFWKDISIRIVLRKCDVSGSYMPAVLYCWFWSFLEILSERRWPLTFDLGAVGCSWCYWLRTWSHADVWDHVSRPWRRSAVMHWWTDAQYNNVLYLKDWIQTRTSLPPEETSTMHFWKNTKRNMFS